MVFGYSKESRGSDNAIVAKNSKLLILKLFLVLIVCKFATCSYNTICNIELYVQRYRDSGTQKLNNMYNYCKSIKKI